MASNISYFAQSNFRHKRVFGIRQADRLMHMFILGKTGTGKTTLMTCLAQQDIRAKRGFCLLDPLGDMVTEIYEGMSQQQKDKAIYINLTDSQNPWRYNPLKKVSLEKQGLVTSGIISVLHHVFQTSWGDRLEHILRYTILALLQQPQASFKDILSMIQDEEFRKRVLPHIKTQEVRAFWTQEFQQYTKGSLIPLLNKMGSFLAYPAVRGLLYENTQEFHLRSLMDKGNMLLVNLSKGVIGTDASSLIGSLLITSLGHAAFSRADTSEHLRRQFILYVDEFQSFSGANLPHMLAELRKYKVGIVLANQYLDQLKQETREAVLGNVGTFISFRVGGKDAPYVAREMQPQFTVEDLVKLPNYHIYLKLLVGGKPSKPFSATSIRHQDLSTLY